jgi:hypothetical protein
MPFGSYKDLEEVLRTFQVTLHQERFIQPVPFPVDEHFRKRLETLRQIAPVSASEEAICEFMIAPILQEVWLHYSDALMMWSHVSMSLDDKVAGYPDYFFARRSPLGPVRDKPYVLFIEAKRFLGRLGPVPRRHARRSADQRRARRQDSRRRFQRPSLVFWQAART